MPDVIRIEMLSQQNRLMHQDIMIAHNLKIISKNEALVFKMASERRKGKRKRGEMFKDLDSQLCSVINEISKIKEKLEEYSESGDYLIENAVILGKHMENEWNRWKKRFNPNEYPDPPPGMIRPTTMGIGVPSISGIYFVWENGNIVYVGQSINMSNRVRLKHESIFATDLLSFIPIEKDNLDWAEYYYIGILKPKRNFKSHTQGAMHSQSIISDDISMVKMAIS